MPTRKYDPCYYIGIDPGLNGAIAILKSDGTIYKSIIFPTVKELSPKGRKMSRPDVKELVEIFASLSMFCYSGSYIMIEKQVAMPGQNAIGTFNTGKGYGILLALLQVYFPKAKVEFINCKEWQEKMIERTPVESKIRRDKRKQLKLDSIAKAKKLYPDFNFKKSAKSKVDSDGHSDALLIATYNYCLNKK